MLTHAIVIIAFKTACKSIASLNTSNSTQLMEFLISQVPVVVSLCERLLARIKGDDQTSRSHDDTDAPNSYSHTSTTYPSSARDATESQLRNVYTLILCEAVDLLGTIVAIGGEGAGNEDGGGESTRVGEGSGGMALGLSLGVSVSDRWCIVTLLLSCVHCCIHECTNNLEAYSKGSSLREESLIKICKRVLRTIGSIINKAGPTLMSLLLALQVPSCLCECLIPAVSGRSDGDSASSGIEQLSALAAHALALLLHTVGPQWQTSTYTPLASMLAAGGGSVGGGVHVGENANRPPASLANFDVGSERAMLRQRVIRSVCDSLVEGLGIKINVILRILENVCDSGHDEDDKGHGGVSGKRSNALSEGALRDQRTLRTAVLRVLAHTTGGGGRYVSECVCAWGGGRAVRILLDCVGSSRREGRGRNAGENEAMWGKSGGGIDSFSHGLALATLTHLIRNRCLPFQVLLKCASVVSACVNITDDARVLAAALALLSSLLSLAQTPPLPPSTPSVLSIAGSDPEEESEGEVTLTTRECTELIERICDGVCNKNTLSVISGFMNLFAPSPTSPTSPSIASLISNPSMWLLGSEFGHRQSGLLDGPLSLLAKIGRLAMSESDGSYSNSSVNVTDRCTSQAISTCLYVDEQGNQLAATVCRLLQSGGGRDFTCWCWCGSAVCLCLLPRYADYSTVSVTIPCRCPTTTATAATEICISYQRLR